MNGKLTEMCRPSLPKMRRKQLRYLMGQSRDPRDPVMNRSLSPAGAPVARKLVARADQPASLAMTAAPASQKAANVSSAQ